MNIYWSKYLTYGFPFSGTFQEAGVIRSAYELSCPLKMVLCDKESKESGILGSQGALMESASWFQVSSPAVILETVKRAERQQDALVLRLYEAFGSEAQATLTILLPVSKVSNCTALEDEIGEVPCSGGVVHITLKPFQVMSLLAFLRS